MDIYGWERERERERERDRERKNISQFFGGQSRDVEGYLPNLRVTEGKDRRSGF